MTIMFMKLKNPGSGKNNRIPSLNMVGTSNNMMANVNNQRSVENSPPPPVSTLKMYRPSAKRTLGASTPVYGCAEIMTTRKGCSSCGKR